MSIERLHVTDSPWWGEHEFRYDEVIRRGVEGARVLDGACGSAFGTRMLSARGAALATGLDVSFDSLLEAARNGGTSGVKLCAGDVSRLPMAHGSCDVVVSFETIEHTRRYEEAVREYARVLRPGGVLYLSTPNRPVLSPDGVVNPFHTQEFDRAELESLLTPHFDSVTIHGQRYVRWGRDFSPGRAMEWLLLRRGVRKLPLAVQNRLMRGFGAAGIYPTAGEFELTADPHETSTCPTLFAICGK